MDLKELAQEVYDIACEKGWHDEPLAFGDAIANIHGEASEAFEEYRKGKNLNDIYLSFDDPTGKPEGVPIEFADIIIRVLDNCITYDIDIEAALMMKLEYNKNRPYKHGGKIV
jgi:NTP pyrophosphatase (non-canonical NTP hydrolase)